jgi:hypothetical protein
VAGPAVVNSALSLQEKCKALFSTLRQGSLAEKDAKARAAKPEDFADLSIIKELDQQAY